MVTLFSTDCPKCLVLEKKLKEKNIDFNVSKDIKEIMNHGFLTAPVLKVNNDFMLFSEAVKWVNNQ